jgi:hypothetical protein
MILGLALCLGTLFALAPAFAGGSFVNDDRNALDNSGSWGIDLDTGKVAIDASLLFVLDPTNRALVINPNTADEAAKELGATIERDGSWHLGDGSAYTPIKGELAIVVGDEPEGLVEASGLPAVPVSRVNLISAMASGAKRTRSWHKCSGCAGCAQGCNVNVLYTGDPSFKYCKFSWPWNHCSEEFKEVCKVTYFSCINCSGSVTGTTTVSTWVCADNC